MNLSETEIKLIRVLQDDLPLTENPFADVAQKAGLSETEALDKIREWKQSGTIRRFGALLAHRQAGFDANGMGIWNVTDGQLESAGELFSKNPSVSHCYARPAFKDWPYRLYTMIHGRTREEVKAVAEELSELSGIKDYSILFSTREFKKSDTRLFREED